MAAHSRLHKFLVAASLSTGLVLSLPSYAVQDVAHAVTGIVKHVDHESKVLVVKAADGTEHTIHYTDKTAVKAGKGIKKGSADTWLEAKEGSEVTVHYSEKAGEKTADAVKDAAEKTGKSLK